MTSSLFGIIHPRRSKPAVKTLVCVHWGSLNWEATGLCGKFLDVGLHPGLSSPKLLTPLVMLPRGTGEPSGGIPTQLGETVDPCGLTPQDRKHTQKLEALAGGYTAGVGCRHLFLCSVLMAVRGHFLDTLLT